MIAKYLHNTHAKTHSSYTVDIVQIFRTSKEGEVERFRSTKGVGGTEPDFSEAQLLDDGVVVPLGKPKENTSRPKVHYCTMST
nr:poly [ADP-ribose] polymerase 2-like [Malus domestica]